MVAAIAAGAAWLATTPAWAAPGPGTTPSAAPAAKPSAAALAARTNPAVRLLVIDLQAPLGVPTAMMNTQAINVLADRIDQEAANGTIPADTQSRMTELFKGIAADPGTYLSPGTPMRQVHGELTLMCTGWVVTPDGYIVTAAHCTNQDPKQLAQEFGRQALQKLDKQDAEGIVKSFSGAGTLPITDEDIKLLIQAVSEFNASHLSMGEVSQQVGFLQRAQGGGKPTLVPLDVIASGKPYPGKDYAILKQNGATRLPSLALGDRADVQIGDQVYVDGYPGTVMTEPFTTSSQLTPTFTQGPVSATRTTTSNVAYLQTQAPAYHGNSGGPVLGPDGKVIGTLIAGAVSSSGQENVQGYEFVLPVSAIRDALREHNITPALAPTTTTFNRAVDDYFAHYYTRALHEFAKVRALVPDYPGLTTLVTNAHRAVAAGKDRTPKPSSSGQANTSRTALVVALAAGAGALVVIVLITLAARRRRAALASSHHPWPTSTAAGWPGTQAAWPPAPTAPAPPQWTPPQWTPPQWTPSQWTPPPPRPTYEPPQGWGR